MPLKNDLSSPVAQRSTIDLIANQLISKRIVSSVKEARNKRKTTPKLGKLHYTRRLMFALSHSSPSYRPSPDVAHAAYEKYE